MALSTSGREAEEGSLKEKEAREEKKRAGERAASNMQESAVTCGTWGGAFRPCVRSGNEEEEKHLREKAV